MTHAVHPVHPMTSVEPDTLPVVRHDAPLATSASPADRIDRAARAGAGSSVPQSHADAFLTKAELRQDLEALAAGGRDAAMSAGSTLQRRRDDLEDKLDEAVQRAARLIDPEDDAATVATKVGTGAGAMAGALIGVVGGPIGVAAGATLGALAGGLTGRGIAASADDASGRPTER